MNSIAIFEILDFSPYRARMKRRERRALDRMLQKHRDFDFDIASIGLRLIVRGDWFGATAIDGVAK